MKKINKFICLSVFIFVMIFTLTSCDIEELLNQYLPGVELPFGDKTKEPTNNETNNHTYENSCKDGNHNFGDYYQNNETHHYLTCQDCGEYKYESHDFTDWTILEEPTEHSMGLKIRTCNICKWDEKVDIPMLDKEDTPTDSFISDCYGFRIHYYRPDSNYDGWNLWVWIDGFEGTSYNINGIQDDDGVTFVFKWEDLGIYDYKNKMIGFIVRKGEWELKDVEADRFIDFSYHSPKSDGYMDFYLISKEHEIFFEPVDNKPVQEIFIEDMYLLSSVNGYSFTEDTKFTIDKKQDIAYIDVALKVGDSFIISSLSKEVIYDFKNTHITNDFEWVKAKFNDEIMCIKEGYYTIVIYNYSNKFSRKCVIEIDDIPLITTECTVAEALNLPLGSNVRITGYVNKNGNYYDISDHTGSMRLYDYTGHVHDNLYGVVEGILYDYNGIIELCPCTFTNLDFSQLSKIKLGNIIKDNNRLYNGLKVTFGTSNQLIGCKYNNYYNTSEFEYSGDWINVCTEVFTLIKENEYWLFESINGGYLSSSEKNELNILPDNNDYSRWNINIDSSGEALVSNLALNYFIKFNTSTSPNRVTTGLQGSLVTPYLYIIEEYKEPIVDYDEFYVRGSFNDWLALDDYKLNYNRFTNRYSIKLFLETGTEFKIADNEWFKQYNAYNISSNFELKENFENIVAPYTGEYEIIINNYNFPEESCEIIYKASYDDVYLTSSIDNYNIKYENKFNQAYSKYNLIYDIEIEEGNTYLYSVKSLREVYYTNHLGTISEYVSFNDEIIDFKEPGSYRIIIENFKDLENIKIHILLNNIELSIEQALNYPDSALVKLMGEFLLEDSKMYLANGINKIKLYNYSHVHSGEKGSIIGEVYTYLNEKEIVNGNITVTETNYVNQVEIISPVMKDDDLINGLKIIIAYDNYVMTCQNSKYRNTTYFEDLYSKLNTCVGVFELVKVDNYWKLKDIIGGYLYLKDTDKNELYTGTVTDESDLWNISIVNGFASIQNVLYTERYIQINSTKLDRFTSYRNNQSNPSIYIIKNEEVDFSILNMVCLGDSITYGYEPYTGKKMQNPYPELVKELLGLNSISNYGIPGDTVGYAPDRQIMANRYIEMKDNTDIISVLGGINDYRYGIIPLGNIDDNTINTIYGAYNVLAQGLTEKYPNSFIFFMTPYKWAGDKGVCSQGYTLEDMSNVIKEVCAKYDIPVLDLYSNGNLESEFNLSDSDGLHPTQEFLINYTAPQIAEFIKNNYDK